MDVYPAFEIRYVKQLPVLAAQIKPKWMLALTAELPLCTTASAHTGTLPEWSTHLEQHDPANKKFFQSSPRSYSPKVNNPFPSQMKFHSHKTNSEVKTRNFMNRD